MTREEAIANLKELLECNYVDSFDDAENEALEMAIKALNQKTDMLKVIEDIKAEISLRLGLLDCKKDILAIIDKHIEPKIGHWIHFAQSDDCSECRWSTGKYISPSKYCPNCGARMIEPQESEDKE